MHLVLRSRVSHARCTYVPRISCPSQYKHVACLINPIGTDSLVLWYRTSRLTQHLSRTKRRPPSSTMVKELREQRDQVLLQAAIVVRY